MTEVTLVTRCQASRSSIDALVGADDVSTVKDVSEPSTRVEDVQLMLVFMVKLGGEETCTSKSSSPSTNLQMGESSALGIGQ